jgi:hypothetical protein
MANEPTDLRGTLAPNAVIYVDVGQQPPIDVPSIMRAAGYDEGVKSERALIVAWLKAEALASWERYKNGDRRMAGHALEDAVRIIENGGHVSPASPK